MHGLVYALKHPRETVRILVAPLELPDASPQVALRLRRLTLLDRCIGLYLLAWMVSSFMYPSASSISLFSVVGGSVLSWVLMRISRREWNLIKKTWADEFAREALAYMAGRHRGRA